MFRSCTTTASPPRRCSSAMLTWEPRRVGGAGGLPDVGDLILNDEERAFVIACWIATAWRREAAVGTGRDGCRDLPAAGG